MRGTRRPRVPAAAHVHRTVTATVDLVTTADDRPVDPTPVHTADLPATPTRDRNIPAEAWIEAPESLRRSGDDIGHPLIAYKRRLGRWLLWRAGPARGADARYTAIDANDLSRSFSFRLNPDGSGHGTGPSGTHLSRFRDWKQDLRAHGDPEV